MDRSVRMLVGNGLVWLQSYRSERPGSAARAQISAAMYALRHCRHEVRWQFISSSTMTVCGACFRPMPGVRRWAFY